MPLRAEIQALVAVRHNGLSTLAYEKAGDTVRISVPELRDCLAVVVTTSPKIIADLKDRLAGFRPHLQRIGAMPE